MKLIVAVDKNWGIGQNGDQPYHIPEDQAFFRKKTADNVVVMGRVTLAALPGGRPLKNRINIVLSRGDIEVPGAQTCSSVSELAGVIEKHADKDVFVIGGQQIYEILLDYCEYAYVTKIKSSPAVDRYFPNLDTIDNWELVAVSETKTHNGLEFCFCEYRNLSQVRL